MKSRKKTHLRYLFIAFGTVLFWRAVWNLIDRIPGVNDSFLFDIATGAIGLATLWFVTRSFEHLD